MSHAPPVDTSDTGAQLSRAPFQWQLDGLNFFLADVRGGLGAFVSVFLVTSAGWSAASIGQVLTISGLLGIALHTPVGTLIDDIKAKRALLVGAVVLLAICAIAIERYPIGPVVFTADVTMAVLGGVFAPVVAAITLGLVPERAFPARLARNAVFDRAGNIVVAVLVGLVGWYWTENATFYMIPAFALLAVAVVLAIPAGAIDHDRARGFDRKQVVKDAQPVLRFLLSNKPLLLLAAIAATFHFANASLLPLVGQKLALAHPGYETVLMSACILLAQLVTIPVALIVGRKASLWSLKWMLAAASVALIARALIFAVADMPAILIAAQALDGVSAGIWDVLLPLMLADYIVGSGRYSASRGMVSTVQGVGGSLSNVVTGTLVTASGYSTAFLFAALFAGAACALIALLPEPETEKERRTDDVT